MLHLPTLLLVEVSVTLLMTLLMAIAALLAGDRPEQRWWALGNVVATLGLAVGAQTAAPDVVHAVLSYGLIGLGLGLVLRGLRLYCGEDLSLRWLFAIAGLALVLPAIFLWGLPSLSGRLIVTGAYFGLLNLACVAVLLRGVRDATRPVMWVSASGFLVLGLVLLLRALFLGWELSSPDAARNAELVMGLTLFVIPLTQVAIGFGMMLMIARRYAEELRRLSLTDKLTGAFNRAGLEGRGGRVLQRARMARRPVSLAMIDADHFKRINYSHGHPAGDAVLRQLADGLFNALRPGDLLARYGGEELVVLLDGTGLAGATQVAERLRRLVEAAPARHEALSIPYTVSIGVASSEGQGHGLSELLACADKALYQAKQQGRNRVVGL